VLSLDGIDLKPKGRRDTFHELEYMFSLPGLNLIFLALINHRQIKYLLLKI
jgi:hypothetical protein